MEMNDQDESRPLLSNYPRPFDNHEPSYGVGSPVLANVAKLYDFRRRLLIMLLAILGILLLPATLYSGAPTGEQLQQYFTDTTKTAVQGVKFKGWRAPSDPNFRRSDFAVSSADKWMVFGVNLTVHMDYDSNKTSTMTGRQEWAVKTVASKFIRNVCVTVSNSTTYGEDEDEDDSIAILGSAFSPDKNCFSLGTNKTTELVVDIYLQPQIKNLAKLLKRYQDGLDLENAIWSDIKVAIDMPILGNKFYWSLRDMNIKNFRWYKYIPWEKFRRTLRHLYTITKEIVEDAKVENIHVEDAPGGTGFLMRGNLNTPHILKMPEWLNVDLDTMVPSTEWGLRLPACEFDDFVELDGTNISIMEVPLSELFEGENISLPIEVYLAGPISGKLLYEICSYQRENLITPISKLLRRLFEPNEPIQVSIFGHKAIQREDSIIPVEFASEIVRNIDSSFKLNYTSTQEDLIDEIGMKSLNLKWHNNGAIRTLIVTGDIVGTMHIPSYELNENSNINITHVKGLAKLYHNGIHIVDAPMKTWTRCLVKIVDNKLQFIVQVNEEDVEIVNGLQLSRCLNEVLLRGRTKLQYKVVIDLITTSPLGKIPLFSVPGEGNTVITKKMSR
ncbi:HFL151Wp [Eremothecium sinecaudum]|uniref:HFL151Wp n=1 Tax=Eremothecium sinecaudum TaxID=45286 RepID=A0A109UZN7_9SACH|nr:HFL151Wp [Eremothecium sinecaudum]AMD21705.1 HFL151Wp [Eremothecium sinecaudum]